uniref:Uncharacterized protein n=1 Tax=Anguilla anguilla TaxID=7936 RepID=A0A0E9PN84_ANGAN
MLMPLPLIYVFYIQRAVTPLLHIVAAPKSYLFL